MDNYIGRMLDNRYEILEVIGIGGMAVVYKARCHRLNRLVAIKILKDEFSQDAEFRRRFHAESQAVAMLSHPNIVSVYDVSHSGDTDYIVMELIDGITLKQYMEQKGQLNWRETLHFSTQIAKALEHAHSRGIIHRDIKPHNIMILKDGSVKVADFGIARITSAQSTLTREALGSVHYISPEQARGSRVDKRTDLYSLGVVMYEMLTGRPPFDGDSPVAVAIQHINGTPVLPTELNAGIPKGLEQITMHAMTAALDQRYESSTDMLSDLEEFRKNPNVIFEFTASGADRQPQSQEPAGEAPAGGRTAEGRAGGAARSSQAARRAAEPRRQPEQTGGEKPSRGNRAAVIAGVICIALAVCGIFYFLYESFLRDVFSETEDVVVPGFVGKLSDDVIDNEQYADFKLVFDWVNDEAPYGTILTQSPDQGTTVKQGAEVKLQASLGPETDEPETMPGLVGKTLESAQSILDGMNFGTQVVREYHDEVEKGRVIETDPREGTALSPGQVIILTVSEGPEEEPAIVPPLEGLNIDEALEAIEKAGLEVGSLRYEADKLPKDTVFYQSLDQDTEVKKGTKINLLISLGPDGEEEPPETDPDEPTTEPDPEVPDEPAGPSDPTPSVARITVALPQDRDSTVITITVDDVVLGEPFEVSTAQGTVELQVQGSGTQLVTIYFDGVKGWSNSVTFPSGSGTAD